MNQNCRKDLFLLINPIFQSHVTSLLFNSNINFRLHSYSPTPTRARFFLTFLHQPPLFFLSVSVCLHQFVSTNCSFCQCLQSTHPFRSFMDFYQCGISHLKEKKQVGFAFRCIESTSDWYLLAREEWKRGRGRVCGLQRSQGVGFRPCENCNRGC